MKILIGLIVLAALAGCTGPQPFVVTEADTRFQTDKNPIFYGENNRISSRSIAGGMHIDSTGVYVNPVVTKDRASGEVLALALSIQNLTEHGSTFGGINSLGLMREIAFELDGEALVLGISGADRAFGDTIDFNTISRMASVDITESGIAPLTVEQYAQIIEAETVSVQIRGSDNTATYEADQLADSFLPNLRAFYAAHLKN